MLYLWLQVKRELNTEHEPRSWLEMFSRFLFDFRARHFKIHRLLESHVVIHDTPQSNFSLPFTGNFQMLTPHLVSPTSNFPSWLQNFIWTKVGNHQITSGRSAVIMLAYSKNVSYELYWKDPGWHSGGGFHSMWWQYTLCCYHHAGSGTNDVVPLLTFVRLLHLWNRWINSCGIALASICIIV